MPPECGSGESKLSPGNIVISLVVAIIDSSS